MIFSCIIIDDDIYAVEQIVEYIALMPVLRLIKSYSDSLSALQEIKRLEKPVDFLFTDINMPGISGIELSKQIGSKIKCLVLVSGHINYAVEGYAVDAKYFLTKPFNFEKFKSITNDLIQRAFKEKPFVIIKLSGKNNIVKVYVDDIIAIEGYGNYIKIHTINEMLTPYYKLSEMENKLKEYLNFKRVSKSFIISTKHIVKINGYNITLKDCINVWVGESYKNHFSKNLMKWVEII